MAKMANGFVCDQVLAGQKVRIFLAGINTVADVLTPGQHYYLGINGGIITGQPEVGYCQDIGVAISTDKIMFHPYPVVDVSGV